MTARTRSALLAGIALGSAVLFTLYLRQSRSVVVGSDGGSIALQAWAMLHGNVLLHGWAMSDVSFYPTELPQYALLEWLRGLNPDVVHLGGAMTYTIVLLLAALVAKGNASGAEAAVRVLMTAGIMLAPAAGDGTSTLLLTPDHLGSVVPILLAWLIIDRCPPRWYVPVAVGALLSWGLVADALIEITGVAPLVLLCAIRVMQRIKSNSPNGPVGAPGWFEPALGGAALASIAASALVSALIRADGGFVLRPVGTRFAGLAKLPHNAVLTGQGILMLFGASFGRGQHVNLIFSSLHLVGVALVAAAFCVAATRFFRRGELLVPALAVAIALNVILYVHGNYAQNLLSSREITEVLPFGAVLAGRVMAGPVLRLRISGVRVLVPALGAVLAGYALVLAVYSAAPPAAPENQALARWLVAHRLTGGLAASYWLANIVTVDSGGHADVRQISIHDRALAVPGGGWGFARQWYSPARHDADFVVTNATPGSVTWHSLLNSARNTFGPPARVYSYQQYTVLVWGKNLLPRLG